MKSKFSHFWATVYIIAATTIIEQELSYRWVGARSGCRSPQCKSIM